jgi:hypothetical protein
MDLQQKSGTLIDGPIDIRPRSYPYYKEEDGRDNREMLKVFEENLGKEI